MTDLKSLTLPEMTAFLQSLGSRPSGAGRCSPGSTGG